MKNIQFFTVLLIGTFTYGGCSTGKKSAPDAYRGIPLVEPAPARDGSLAADVFVGPDIPPDKPYFESPLETYKGRPELLRKDGAIDTSTDMAEVSRDSGTDDPIPSVPEAGPEAQADTKDAFTTDILIWNPVPGHYTAKLDPALSKEGDTISRLGSYGFTVGSNATGQLELDATYDGWAHYGCPIVYGAFDLKHGQGFEGSGGTHCPTDGFAIVGSFVSPTEARGIYKDMSWRCQVVGTGYFIATLDQPPDSGVAADTAPFDANAVDATPQ